MLEEGQSDVTKWVTGKDGFGWGWFAAVVAVVGAGKGCGVWGLPVGKMGDAACDWLLQQQHLAGL